MACKPAFDMVRFFSRLIVVASVLASGCGDESLPPRDEPAQVLSTMWRVTGPLVLVTGTTPYPDQGAFDIQARNVYSEVLQDSAGIRLDLDVWLKSDSTQRGVVRGTAANLWTTWLLRNGLLTLGPDSTARIFTQWSHRTNTNIPFWTLVPLGERTNARGVPFLQSDTVVYVARGSVQFFKNLATQFIDPFEFKLVYQIYGDPGR